MGILGSMFVVPDEDSFISVKEPVERELDFYSIPQDFKQQLHMILSQKGPIENGVTPCRIWSKERDGRITLKSIY